MPEVVVGIIVRDSSVLMLKRAKAEGALQWNFPGGKIEAGETIAVALQREIREETGLSCSVQRILGSRVHPDTGVTIHYAVCLPEAGTARNLEPAKADQISWIPAVDVPAIVTSNLYPPLAEFLSSLSPTQ